MCGLEEGKRFAGAGDGIMTAEEYTIYTVEIISTFVFRRKENGAYSKANAKSGIGDGGAGVWLWIKVRLICGHINGRRFVDIEHLLLPCFTANSSVRLVRKGVAINSYEHGG